MGLGNDSGDNNNHDDNTNGEYIRPGVTSQGVVYPNPSQLQELVLVLVVVYVMLVIVGVVALLSVLLL
jgi:hypothetical protein